MFNIRYEYMHTITPFPIEVGRYYVIHATILTHRSPLMHFHGRFENMIIGYLENL